MSLNNSTPESIARDLAEARARTLLLVAPVAEDDLRRQHDPLMGPILWDLGHIAHFEELWLLDNLRDQIRFSEMPGMFNPFEYPRAQRGALNLPSLCATIDKLNEVRARVLGSLELVDFSDPLPLLANGYVYRMVLQHEYQHDETILQTLQLKRGDPYAAPRAAPVLSPSMFIESGRMVRFRGGEVPIGTRDRSAAYDNERPQHNILVAPFEIDTAPVTNRDFLGFMQDGGYRRRELWSEAGWTWLEQAQVAAPKYWVRDGNGWCTRIVDRTADADSLQPVCHVCYYEAEAYARWVDKRLPTECEWETAASFDPATGEKRFYPWGEESPTPLHANLDQLAFDTAPVGSYPRNVSPLGCYGMIGDTWEWTASDFRGYPGFEHFPYPEYSEVFFGADYKVLRGGSWATRPGAIRNTFRNWDYPVRRQLFSGFRCARDA